MNGRNNQQERGLSVNQDLMPPKLTKEQRATMTKEEKKEYSKNRLIRYRELYRRIYMKDVLGITPHPSTQEKAEAVAFYRKYKAEQSILAV